MWVRAIGGGKARWCKFGVSLRSGKIGGATKLGVTWLYLVGCAPCGPIFVVAVRCGFARSRWKVRFCVSPGHWARKTFWHKFGVFLGSGMVGGVQDACCYIVVFSLRVAKLEC